MREDSPFVRRVSQQSRITDTGVVDAETEHSESPTKPVRSVSLFIAVSIAIAFVLNFEIIL